jgi:hypothetical protein
MAGSGSQEIPEEINQVKCLLKMNGKFLFLLAENNAFSVV